MSHRDEIIERAKKRIENHKHHGELEDEKIIADIIADFIHYTEDNGTDFKEVLEKAWKFRSDDEEFVESS